MVLGAGALCIAAPVAALDRNKASRGPSPAITAAARLAKGPAPPPAWQAPGRFANDSIVREAGTPGDRRAVVGSMDLIGPLAVEAGLFSVTGASPKEREAKRGDSPVDVQPRRSRVAAVGLRMRF